MSQPIVSEARTFNKLQFLQPKNRKSRTKAGALAGQALVLFDPQRMLIDEVVLCEDGHAQERSLLDQVLPLLAKNDLLIADRNFCTLAFLFGIKACGARFIIREHRAMPSKSLRKPRYVGLCETGRVYEEPSNCTTREPTARCRCGGLPSV